MIFVAQDRKIEEQLRKGTHVFQLGRAVTVRGVVVSADGAPISGADVSVGHVGESQRRETKSLLDGTFGLDGCKPGKNLLSATASGYAPSTLDIVVAESSPPFRIALSKGKTLRLRVLNAKNEPIPKANIWLDTFNRGPIDPGNPAPSPVQVEFNPVTDDEGRAVWENAPDAEMSFDFHARGYMRLHGVKLRPDNTEHVVTLSGALTVSGTVRDATTREPFRIFEL